MKQIAAMIDMRRSASLHIMSDMRMRGAIFFHTKNIRSIMDVFGFVNNNIVITTLSNSLLSGHHIHIRSLTLAAAVFLAALSSALIEACFCDDRALLQRPSLPSELNRPTYSRNRIGCKRVNMPQDTDVWYPFSIKV